MGLSSKQVSGDMLDWGQNLLQSGTLELPKTFPMKRQQQQQQSEPLKCPRCASTNTKFCYYNNYNKTQPRHFCKSCKRHWTKGGTLRNVPVGGGRKNKRLKTSNTTNTDVNNRISTNNTRMATDQNQQEYPNLPLALDHEQKGLSHILSQALIRPPYSMQHDAINNFSGKSSNNNNGVFLGSGLTLPLHDFPFSSSSSFGSNPSSISTCFESSNVYDYIGGIEAMKDSIITSILPSTSSSNITQPWQVPKTSTVMDMPTSYWSGTNWDDFETFVSSTDLNIPWDDSDIKPC